MNRPDLIAPTADDLAAFATIVGDANVLTDASDTACYLTEWRDRYIGRTAAVLRPGTADEVAAILAHANARRIAVVPQGGNTGLVGGQIPFESGREIVLSLSRLNRIRACGSSPGQTSGIARGVLVCEAGVTLAAARAAASEKGLLFPLSLASEGTCQIGGNLATNAGGTAVLAYGNMRELTLGLEVVLADGSTLHGLSPLKKDNTGYDLKNLFIGSEGTLGIITAAALALFERPTRYETAFVACPSLDALGRLFEFASTRAGPQLTAFEFIPARLMGFLERHVAGARSPLETPSPWYVLMELSHFDRPLEPRDDDRDHLPDLLAAAVENGYATDAAFAASEANRSDFWRLREELSDVQKREGGSIKHDVSVRSEQIPAFIAEADAMIEALCPGARPVPFGHFGDGNVHYNVSQPEGADKDAFLAQWETIAENVHDLVARYGGSISAEHGIGRMKRDVLPKYKDPASLKAMRAIKQALDPNGILNPGKLL